MYALCLRAVETGIYADMPEISQHLHVMKNGLEMAYLKLGIPLYEYRKFVICPGEEIAQEIPQPPLGKGGKCLSVGLVSDSINRGVDDVCALASSMPLLTGALTSTRHKTEYKGQNKGEEENVEVGTEQKKEG